MIAYMTWLMSGFLITRLPCKVHTHWRICLLVCVQSIWGMEGYDSYRLLICRSLDNGIIEQIPF